MTLLALLYRDHHRPFALRLCRVFIIASVILHHSGDIGGQNHFLTGWLRIQNVQIQTSFQCKYNPVFRVPGFLIQTTFEKPLLKLLALNSFRNQFTNAF